MNALPLAPSLPMQAILVSSLQNLTIGVLAVGRDGIVIVANPVACELLGRDLDQTAGRRVSEVLAAAPGSAALLAAFHDPKAQPLRRDWTRQGEAGDLLTLELTASRAEPPWDDQLAGLVLIEDVTELRRLVRQNELRSRLTGMGEMAIGLAHEIRNPLGSIGLLAETLERELEDREELAQLAAQILAGVRSLEHLVSNTLEFARPRRLAVTRVSLAQALADALGWVEHPLVQKGACLEFDISRAPQGCIAGDAEQLRQVFLNLLLNAIQAVGEDGLISVRLESAEAGWRVLIRDDGPGIPPTIIDKIFDPFFTTRDKGSGIGLAVAHAIVTAHGGRIQVQSEPGRGATFSVYLPENIAIEER